MIYPTVAQSANGQAYHPGGQIEPSPLSLQEITKRAKQALDTSGALRKERAPKSFVVQASTHLEGIKMRVLDLVVFPGAHLKLVDTRIEVIGRCVLLGSLEGSGVLVSESFNMAEIQRDLELDEIESLNMEDAEKKALEKALSERA